jgi:WG containing repeat
MKRIFLVTIIALLFGFSTFAQNKKDVWLAFQDKDSTLIGFKDKNGHIKIKPRFSNYITAGRFENIIEVSEEKDGKTIYYYLTKKGRTVGKDNPYIIDNSPDCESEGFIRFRDKKTHRVGMFNSNGDIAIPAEYDNLMPVRNGMIMALKGGHWDVSKQTEENQYPWVGGKEILINTHNKVLIDKFPLDEEINFFSLIISAHPDKNPILQNFKATDGKYYSFISFDKEFSAWLKDSLLNNLTESRLLEFSYKNITFWDTQKHWASETQKQFVDQNFKVVMSKLGELNAANYSYDIFTDDLNPYIYNSKEFEKYFDNCGAFKKWIYPVKNVVISHSINKDVIQDQFLFLRTNSGYKLIEVDLKVGMIK